MAIPTYVPGQVLTANDCSLWFTPRAVTTTGDMTLTSQPALQNDTTLVLPVDASASYDVDFYAVFDGPTANGVNWAFTGPSGAVLSLWIGPQATTVAGNTFNEIGLSATFTPILTNGAGTNLTNVARGTLVTGANAGNLQFQWCQNSSSGTATRRRARSRLILRRIS